jgi:hypothetical protein
VLGKCDKQRNGKKKSTLSYNADVNVNIDSFHLHQKIKGMQH